MQAKKSLGQNFLMHTQTAERIVTAAQLPPDATVFEIGPGTGMLTRVLLAHAAQVIAVEADDALIPQLQQTFANEITSKKLTLIHGDARTFDTQSIKGEYHVVANIPYYITGELMRLMLTANHPPRSVTMLVQKEVAERIARTKKESLLSLAVKAFGTPEYCFTVPKGAFKPAPKVDSAVLAIRDINPHAFSEKSQENGFFSVLHAGFAHKRKRLAKNLEAISDTKTIETVFETLSLNKNIRAEDVPLPTWRILATNLAA